MGVPLCIIFQSQAPRPLCIINHPMTTFLFIMLYITSKFKIKSFSPQDFPWSRKVSALGFGNHSIDLFHGTGPWVLELQVYNMAVMSRSPRNHRVPSASCQATLAAEGPVPPLSHYTCAHRSLLFPGWLVPAGNAESSFSALCSTPVNGVAWSGVHCQGCLLLCFCFYKKYWCLA